MREAVHRYKFGGLSCYARPWGALMAQCVQDHLTGRYDLVTWVPLSRARRRKRGYDQAQLLARSMVHTLGGTALPLLQKTRHTGAQSTLSDQAHRRANVLGAYRALCPEGLRDKRILLTDDVVTSGATLSECARTLLTAGAREVICVTLAKAGK